MSIKKKFNQNKQNSTYFKGRNFRDFAIFGKIRETLFPRNICYL